MLVSSQVLRNSYLPDGVVKEFPYSFPILESSHIKVVKEVTVVDPISLTATKSTEEIPVSEYSVLGAGDEQGGTIVFNNPPANGVPITILRNTPFVQLYKYTELDNFPAESHENALSLHVMMCLQILEIVSRAIVLPETSTEKPSDVLSNFYEMYETVKIADEKMSIALQNLFTQTIQTFTTQDGVLEYELGTDYVDPNSNNLLLVMDHVVQQPDVAYKIIAPNKIAFTSNPGAGHEVWGISSLSFANPDIRAIIENAKDDCIAILQAEGKKWSGLSKAWAESDTPPDPADENSKSAKTWAMIASDAIPIATDILLGKVKGGGNIIISQDGTMNVEQSILDSIAGNTQAITNLQADKLDKSAISSVLDSESEETVLSSLGAKMLNEKIINSKKVTLLEERTEIGNVTLTGVEVGKPIFILSSQPTVNSMAYAYMSCLSGSLDGIVPNSTITAISLGLQSGNYSTNIACVIPTQDTVVFNISVMTGGYIVRFYQ